MAPLTQTETLRTKVFYRWAKHVLRMERGVFFKSASLDKILANDEDMEIEGEELQIPKDDDSKKRLYCGFSSVLLHLYGILHKNYFVPGHILFPTSVAQDSQNIDILLKDIKANFHASSSRFFDVSSPLLKKGLLCEKPQSFVDMMRFFIHQFVFDTPDSSSFEKFQTMVEEEVRPHLATFNFAFDGLKDLSKGKASIIIRSIVAANFSLFNLYRDLVPRQYDWNQRDRSDEEQEVSQYLLVANKIFEIPSIIENDEIVLDEPDNETFLLYIGLLFESFHKRSGKKDKEERDPVHLLLKKIEETKSELLESVQDIPEKFRQLVSDELDRLSSKTSSSSSSASSSSTASDTASKRMSSWNSSGSRLTQKPQGVDAIRSFVLSVDRSIAPFSTSFITPIVDKLLEINHIEESIFDRLLGPNSPSSHTTTQTSSSSSSSSSSSIDSLRLRSQTTATVLGSNVEKGSGDEGERQAELEGENRRLKLKIEALTKAITSKQPDQLVLDLQKQIENLTLKLDEKQTEVDRLSQTNILQQQQIDSLKELKAPPSPARSSVEDSDADDQQTSRSIKLQLQAVQSSLREQMEGKQLAAQQLEDAKVEIAVKERELSSSRTALSRAFKRFHTVLRLPPVSDEKSIELEEPLEKIISIVSEKLEEIESKKKELFEKTVECSQLANSKSALEKEIASIRSNNESTIDEMQFEVLSEKIKFEEVEQKLASSQEECAKLKKEIESLQQQNALQLQQVASSQGSLASSKDLEELKKKYDLLVVENNENLKLVQQLESKQNSMRQEFEENAKRLSVQIEAGRRPTVTLDDLDNFRKNLKEEQALPTLDELRQNLDEIDDEHSLHVCSWRKMCFSVRAIIEPNSALRKKFLQRT